MAGVLTYLVFQHAVAVLFGSVLLIVAIFLIARLAKLSQPLALALALSPMALALALDRAILPAAGLM